MAGNRKTAKALDAKAFYFPSLQLLDIFFLNYKWDQKNGYMWFNINLTSLLGSMLSSMYTHAVKNKLFWLLSKFLLPSGYSPFFSVSNLGIIELAFIGSHLILHYKHLHYIIKHNIHQRNIQISKQVVGINAQPK